MRTNLTNFEYALILDGEVIALFISEECASAAAEAIPDAKVEKDFYTDMSSTYYVEFSSKDSY